MTDTLFQTGRRFTGRFLVVRRDQIPHFILVQRGRGNGHNDQHQRQRKNND